MHYMEESMSGRMRYTKLPFLLKVHIYTLGLSLEGVIYCFHLKYPKFPKFLNCNHKANVTVLKQ